MRIIMVGLVVAGVLSSGCSRKIPLSADNLVGMWRQKNGASIGITHDRDSGEFSAVVTYGGPVEIPMFYVKLKIHSQTNTMALDADSTISLRDGNTLVVQGSNRSLAGTYTRAK